MSEYINRESIRKVLMDVCSDENCPMFITATIDQVIDYEPAADVAPVVHGRWIKTGLRIMTSSGASGSVCVCSICKGQPEIGCTPPYCPNCGAKMDGR